MKRGVTWRTAVWTAVCAAGLVAAAADGPFGLPPGKESGERRTVALEGGVEMTLAWIPAGTVSIAKGTVVFWPEKGTVAMPVDGFWMGFGEVTRKQWKSVMGNDPSYFRGEELPVASRRGELPVECVSWDDCMEFCRRTGLRLPTEMEWWRAHACSLLCGRKRWVSENSGGRTHPVDRENPGQGGLADIDGNVSEWCGDWFAPLPSAPVANYAGPGAGTERVICGGNWCGEDWFDRSLRKERLSLPPGCRYNNVGFRVCLDPVPDGDGAQGGDGTAD